MTTRQRYENHLIKICKDKALRQAVMEFYDDFCEYFQGQVFTKDNFETLKINGEIVEQDIVKDLFKDRAEASPEEVLTWLFTQNITRIYPYKIKTGKTVGRIIALSGKIGIYFPSIKKKVEKIEQGNVPHAYIRAVGMSDKDFEKYVKEQSKARKREIKKNRKKLIADVKNDVYKQIKLTTYHEFCHLLQLRTFCDKRYVKIQLDKETQIRGSVFGSCYEDKITNQTMDDSESAYEMSCECKGWRAMQDLYRDDEQLIRYYCMKMISSGHEAISEYMNEEFSLKIAKEFAPVEGYPFYSLGDFQRKKQVKGDCSYNKNYDIAQLVKLAVGYENEKDMRFNGAEYFARLSNLEVSGETLRQSKEKLHHIIATTKSYASKDNVFVLEMLTKSVDHLNLVGVIGMLMGMFTRFTNDEVVELKTECKLTLQHILIEVIENNIQNELADEQVVKDANYFKKLNSTLETIDSVVMYPKDRVEYYKTSSTDSTKLDPEYVKVIEGLSVDEVSRMYPEMPHLTNFSKLCSRVRIAKTLYEDENPGLSEEMPFFTRQIELDRKRHESLETQSLAIKRKQQAEQERKRLRENRRKQSEEWLRKNGISEDWLEEQRPRHSADLF